jgi:PTH2 family peptidyl-tRNA hydrolase
MSQIKQVIVMRTKYIDADGKPFGMRKGKLISQSSHASMAFLTRRLQKQYDAENPKIAYVEKIDPVTGKIIKVVDAFASGKSRPCFVKYLFTPVEWDWMQGSFAKVCCQVKSEEELMQIYDQAKEAGLEVHLIEDRGLTEFHGVKTATCLAIGPDLSEKIDVITGNLELY